MDCDKDKGRCSKEGAEAFPTIKLYKVVLKRVQAW